LKNEKDTRKEIIDRRLKQAGWIVGDLTQVVEEYSFGINDNLVGEPSVPYGKIQRSDYALLGKNGKPLAVVEAKKSSVNAEVGKEQSKQYCYSIQKQNGGELPFCFYTNGNDIYFWDLENYPPRKVHGFPTRKDLEHLLYLRNARKSLVVESINTKIAGRDYQVAAIRSVLEAIELKKRKFLLVMATGTGKTRTCIALVDALMRFGWAERILFLVDRVALQNQTLDAFKEHLPSEPRWPKPNEKDITTDRRIYVSTYQTMLNIIREEKRILSPHYFDLVIIDECHRSVYNTYGEILEYFNTITLGLTATPTGVVDHDTFELFECDAGIPTFAYSYEEAVNNMPPYLTDFQVMKIKTKFQEEGISKRTISLEDQKKLILQGKEVEEINFEGTEIERNVINKGTNALIVREFMEESIKDLNGVLPGKTIFFCMTKAHARRMEEIFNSLYPEHCGEIAKVIVSEDPRVHGKGGLLDQFTNKDMPRVAISVDMLDTGIDVREITNLVFAKPVFSYTKFWQMIGRGTRLLESHKIKPWCTEKDSFLILDCWDNFDYFKLNPKGKELKPQIPLPVRLFGLRLDKIEKAIELNETEIATKEIEKLKLQIEMMPNNSVVILDAQNDLQQLKDPNFYNPITHQKIEYLRNFVKPLLRTVSNVDFKGMRFEKDIVEVSLAYLSNEKEKFETLNESIIEEISELPLSVNTVAKEQDFIRQAQTNQFWATINEEKFDELIFKLAPLMVFRDSLTTLAPSSFNLQDLLFSKEKVEFGPKHESVSITRYKELVEEKVNALLNSNPTLQKLKDGKTISQTEADQLSETLHNESPHITVDLLRKVYNHRKAQLVQFIRHILGIEILETFPNSVSKSFEQFIVAHSYLSSRQLDFLKLLQLFLLEKGDIEKRDLINAPFTRIHPDGIRGVFSNPEIEEIIIFIKNLAA